MVMADHRQPWAEYQRGHPAHQQLVTCYRAALMAWGRPDLEVGRHVYCDEFVGLIDEPITWSSNTADDDELTVADYDAAYRWACRDVGVMP